MIELVKNSYMADGIALKVWSVSQDYWAKGRQPIPLKVFQAIPHWEAVVEAGLAEIKDDGTGVYVGGTKERHEWRLEHQAASAAGGKASAKRPRDEKGRLLPKGHPSEVQVKPSEAKAIQASSSSSSSFSKEKENTNTGGCLEAWGETLRSFGIEKDPRLDELSIARLIQAKGEEQTRLAIEGARYEAKTDRFNPADHISLKRVTEHFDKFVNQALRRKPKGRETVEVKIPC